MMHRPTFSDMYDEAARHPDYWVELAMLSFSEEMLRFVVDDHVARRYRALSPRYYFT